MNHLVVFWIGIAVAVILSAAVNYEAFSMLDDRPGAPRALGVACGSLGIVCMALLPFMPIVIALQWFATDALAGARLARAIFFIAIGSSVGSLIAVLWSSWLCRHEA
ncbi:hypothetical protein [Dokdonella immobilis]|uniref:Uncharacterized protein n=1 Tax=Dokdonella immobilis TaxID=578942 RepID=A0A1I5ARV3_9GAMM|nr:hypothetical protein [Dokdonella immobilis]SFN65175.1 hypothetical protein SAMN05216289_1421 [Dokdonella immobilis]